MARDMEFASVSFSVIARAPYTEAQVPDLTEHLLYMSSQHHVRFQALDFSYFDIVVPRLESERRLSDWYT